MTEPILSDNLEKAPTELNLSITSNDINIELSKEFLVELRKNIYHRMYNEDVVDHIIKVLKMVDLIYVPSLDSQQLRMKVFPLSLADDAKEWWISVEITTLEELVEKLFCRFYLESYDGEDEMLDEGENWGIDPLEFLSNINTLFKYHKKVYGRTQKESKYENPSNTATDLFFEAYEVRDIEKQRPHERNIDEVGGMHIFWNSTYMALPPREQRHKFLRYEGLEYPDTDIVYFEGRLTRIHMREVHRVLVFNFGGLPDLMAKGLTARMIMIHMRECTVGVSVFTGRAWRRTFDIRGPLVLELILEFFSTFRFGQAILDLDTPGTLQFQLG
ncbi:hypothetical protein Tco_0115051 [Tanacetum coccineum]